MQKLFEQRVTQGCVEVLSVDSEREGFYGDEMKQLRADMEEL